MIVTPDDALSITSERLGWRAADLKLDQELAGSGTNRSFRVRYRDERFVLRIDTPLAARLGLDRETERRAASVAAAAGLAPAPILFDPRGVTVTEFASGRALTTDDCHDEAILARLAVTLHRLHTLDETSVARTDLAASAARYADLAGDVRSRALATRIARRLAALPARPHALCHNDLVAQNILLGQTIQLIDFEYAGRNDPLFDLAVVIEHNGLSGKAARCFTQAYPAADVERDGPVIAQYRLLYRDLVALWAPLAG